MVYRIIVSPRAQKEIEEAIDFYSQYSTNAPLAFISTLEDAYHTLATNPFFSIRYKNIRTLKLKRFPHSLYYIVIEKKNTVRILACFHNKRNPEKRP